MGDVTLPRVTRPCDECPWKVSTPPGQFPACRYENLENTSELVQGQEPWYDAPMFACHKTPEGRERACAGWLAVEGRNHLGVRMAVAQGRVPPGALEPGPDWPDLYPDFRTMASHQGAPHGVCP